MKARITALKAPWPAEAKVGDVVAFEGFESLPAWAVGKCEPAADDADAAHVVTYVAPAPAEQPARILSPIEVTKAIAALQDAVSALQASQADPLASADAQAAAELAALNTATSAAPAGGKRAR